MGFFQFYSFRRAFPSFTLVAFLLVSVPTNVYGGTSTRHHHSKRSSANVQHLGTQGNSLNNNSHLSVDLTQIVEPASVESETQEKVAESNQGLSRGVDSQSTEERQLVGLVQGLMQDPKQTAQSEAKKPDQQMGFLQEELQALREGMSNTIRMESELTSKDVVNVLNGQLYRFTEADIDAVLDSFPLAQRDTAREALLFLSYSANLENISDITRYLEKYFPRVPIVSVANGSLADVVGYLADKKKVVTPTTQMGVFAFHNRGVALLDDATLRRLETDVHVRDAFIENGSKLVYVPGYSDGLNPFNAPRVSNLTQHVQSLVHALQQSGDLTTADLSSLQVAAMQERLYAIDPRLLDQLEVMPRPHSTEHSSDTAAILRNLNGTMGITEDELQQAISSIAGPWQLIAHEVIVQNSQIQSARTMALLAQEQWKQLKIMAEMRGLSENDLVFVVRNADSKSYGVANYIFRAANNLSADQFIALKDAKAFAEANKGRDYIVVAVDDNSGSGESLLGSLETRGELRSIFGPDQFLAFSAAIAATDAFTTAERFRETDSHFTLLAARITLPLKETAMFQEASDRLREGIVHVSGDLGYYGLGTALSLPWMGPDTNTGLFGASHFLRYFIVNQTKTAVQSGLRVSADSTPGTPEHLLLSRVLADQVDALEADIQARKLLSLEEELRIGRRLEELVALAQEVGADLEETVLEDLQRLIEVKTETRNPLVLVESLER